MTKKKVMGNNGKMLWLPLRDEPFGAITVCMMGLIIATALVFIWQYFTPLGVQEQYFFSMSIMGVRPWTLVTHLFMHYPPQLNLVVAIAHIVGNMWFLFLFMNNLEERIKYWILPFYIIGGVLASLVFGLVFKDVFLVGASGAVSCIMGAYYVAFPHNKLTLIGVSQEGIGDIEDVEDLLTIKDKIKYKTMDCKTWLWAWFIAQVPLCIATSNGTAYLAHVAGFIFGVGAVVVFRKIRLYKWLKL